MSEAVLALGGNVGDTVAHMRRAIHELEGAGCTVKAVSRLYRTSPVGYTEQADFINATLLIETNHTPVALLSLCQEIERIQGRRKTIVNGPRPIDLDILLYNDEVIALPSLTIPHPRLHERLFVLAPLCDIIPDRPISGRGTVRQLYEQYTGTERVIPLPETLWDA